MEVHDSEIFFEALEANELLATTYTSVNLAGEKKIKM
jgi:hypothetical protein